MTARGAALQSFSRRTRWFAKSCMMAARARAGEDHGPLRRRLLPDPRGRLRVPARRHGRRPSPRPTRRRRARSSARSSRPSPSDDAKRAFSYAAPSIRAMFGTPERFLAMVRAGYPVVYRAAGATFLIPLRVDGRSRPGRPPHRRRRRALARHLPPRAPARRQLAHRRLRRAAGDGQDDLRRRARHGLSRRRHRQHAPEVGALRGAGAGRGACWRTARSSSRRSTSSPRASGAICRRRRACSAASSPARASGAAPKRSSRSGTSSRAGS